MARKRGVPRRRHKGATRGQARPDACGVLKVNRRGYGFVTTAEGDYFIPASKMDGAMDGDTVVVRPARTGEGARKSGRVVRVMERAVELVVGSYATNGGLGIVTPFDPRIAYDIFTSADAFPDAKTGDVVCVRIIGYPSRNESATGFIEEVIGREDDEHIETEVLIRRYGLEAEFSSAALAEADAAKLDVEAALQEADRRDLRECFIFTIDPTDARDFDDAISVELLRGGRIRLGVHIADVSSYVPWDSSIDLDARRRATSVYLVDRVIPMLPERLSGELCSLKPGCERLAFSVDMVLDSSGSLLESEFYPSVIKSSLRLDYGQVQDFMDGKAPYPSPEVQTALEALDALAQKRYRARIRRGGIDFDSVEAKVELDGAGAVTAIYLRHRTRATGAIEEAMLLANETVASYMEAVTPHMVYRVHKEPGKDAIAALLPLLQELDYPTEGLLDLNPHALQAVLDAAATRPEKDLITLRVLRSMKRAVYSTANIGHYGLASRVYTHFTSPIRRYPDLLVHRLLRAALAGYFDKEGEFSSKCAQKSPIYGTRALKGLRAMCEQLEWLARHSSDMERAAADAAYDSVQIKLCEYMAAFIGEVFDGIVTSVSSAGLFVTLENTVKGLVRIQSLGEEYFIYDPDHQTLIGEASNTRYRIGQQLQVRLIAVSVRDMTTDFELA